MDTRVARKRDSPSEGLGLGPDLVGPELLRRHEHVFGQSAAAAELRRRPRARRHLLLVLRRVMVVVLLLLRVRVVVLVELALRRELAFWRKSF